MAERDFAAERLHSYDVSKNLSGLPYRLNAFVFF
jgi:hypothetical protein